MNDIIREIFKDELKLDVKEVKGTWRDTYKSLENGTIGALGLVTKSNVKKGDILLSRPIFSENLYIASDKKKLESPYDLINKDIYVYKDDDIPIKHLKEYLEKNQIEANIKQVYDVDKHRDEFYLDSELTALRSKNRLLISFLAPVCIAVNKKYGDIFSNYFRKLPLYYQRERFQMKLTEEEREWMKQKKVITTSLEDDISLSMYIKNKDEFIGILPEYISKISKVMEIPIKDIQYKRKGWIYILDKFNKEEIDFLTLSTSDERKTNYIFSQPVDYLPIHLLNHVRSGNYKVGVIKDGKSEEIGKDYFTKDDIKMYNSTTELFEAFRNNVVGYIISPYSIYDKRCSREHKNIKIKDIPINFAFAKNNKVLKNIFNKAIDSIGDIDKIDIRASVEEEQKKNIIFVTIIVLGIMTTKIILQVKLTTALKYDQLTKLQNRYLFNEMCKKSQNSMGMTVVIDLDNFKNTNDKFGHIEGDNVLKEVGAILLKIFDKEDCFRISGDEFYIYCMQNNFNKNLEKLVFLGKKSEILTKYNISFSIGFFLKTKEESMEMAFEKADKEMYEAKKNKGFSFKEFKM